MATFQFNGIDEYAGRLKKMHDKAEGMIKRAVYDGCTVVLKEFRSQISGLPVIKNRYRTTQLPLRGVTQTQKVGLLQGLKSNKMKNNNGLIYTEIWFEGYNGVRNGKYPNGQPNELIANSLNSGSSARIKIPFANRATKAAMGPAKLAMMKRFDEDTKKIME